MRNIDGIIAQAQTPDAITSAMGQHAIAKGVVEKITALEMPIDDNGVLHTTYMSAAEKGCPFAQREYEKYRVAFREIITNILQKQAVDKYIELCLQQEQLPVLDERAVVTKLFESLHKRSYSSLQIQILQGHQASEEEIGNAQLIENALELINDHPQLAYSVQLLMTIVGNYMYGCAQQIAPRKRKMSVLEKHKYRDLFCNWANQTNTTISFYVDLSTQISLNYYQEDKTFTLSNEDCQQIAVTLITNGSFKIEEDYGEHGTRAFRCPAKESMAYLFGKSGLFHKVYEHVCSDERKDEVEQFTEEYGVLTNPAVLTERLQTLRKEEKIT